MLRRSINSGQCIKLDQTSRGDVADVDSCSRLLLLMLLLLIVLPHILFYVTHQLYMHFVMIS